jgi:polygalacturonase
VRRRPAATIAGALAALAMVAAAARAEGPVAAKAPDPWERLPGILAGIHAPAFPDRDFPVTDFGAVAGGTTDATGAFRAAVDACASAGGGRVVVPPGVFLTGPIHLKSNVNLHVSEGATIRFSRDPAAYLPVVRTRWEGVELMGLSPLVYAYEQRDIAITGQGTLDGQADAEHWWPWKRNGHPQSQKPDRDRLFAQAEAGVPVAERVFGAGHYLRPQFFQPYRCTNVLVEGGYQGYMSSEYEGHMYSEESAFEAVSKHHALCRRVLASLLGERPLRQLRPAGHGPPRVGPTARA